MIVLWQKYLLIFHLILNKNAGKREVDGFKAYRYYLAIKLHFTTDKFNVFENRGNVKGTREAFNARNDRYIFEKLARKHEDDKEIIQFFVSNFAYGNDTAIYAGAEADDNFMQWNKRKQSITKIFVDDLATLLTHLEVNKLKHSALFNFTDSEYPVALSLFVGGKISIETLRIIDDFHPIVEKWNQNLSVRYIWDNELRRITKLTGFVKYDKIKIQKVFNHFMEEIAG
jgi:hypothetical protein